MNGNLDFGIKDKVAIVAGGGASGQDIGNGRQLLYCWQKQVQKLLLQIEMNCLQKTQSK